MLRVTNLVVLIDIEKYDVIVLVQFPWVSYIEKEWPGISCVKLPP